MNLGDFEKTNISGLYISKESHPEFGNKYIARFQHDKKRYVKVLGYTNKDNLTRKDAIELFKEFKDSIILKSEVKIEERIKVEGKNLLIKDKDNEILKTLKEENDFLKSILGNYEKLNPHVLSEGIQKIYDLEALKKYQIELIKLQNYLEKENKRMIIIFEGRDASGKGGAIRRITRYMNEKHYRVVALGKP